MITLEARVSGPLGTVSYRVKNSANGETREIKDREASLLGLLLSVYPLKAQVHPLDLFTDESLDLGRKAFQAAYSGEASAQ